MRRLYELVFFDILAGCWMAQKELRSMKNDRVLPY